MESSRKNFTYRYFSFPGFLILIVEERVSFLKTDSLVSYRRIRI